MGSLTAAREPAVNELPWQHCSRDGQRHACRREDRRPPGNAAAYGFRANTEEDREWLAGWLAH